MQRRDAARAVKFNSWPFLRVRGWGRLSAAALGSAPRSPCAGKIASGNPGCFGETAPPHEPSPSPRFFNRCTFPHPRSHAFSFGLAPPVLLHCAALKARFIVNPRSGRAVRALPAVRAFAAARGHEVMLTERSRHASELAVAALAAGCELVVAVGGDGTMNEVASTLIGTGATLGLVPCGSGDGLGRHLRIHGSVAHALRIVEGGRPRTIDTGLADGHPFVTVAGLGFEAEISQRFNRLTRRGFAGYLATSARALREWEPRDYTVAQGSRRDRVRAFTLAVANSDQYGNDARIAPGARVDDGLIDLCAVPPVTPWNALPLLFRLFQGSLSERTTALSRRADRFIVERDGDNLLHTDGEIHQAGRRVEFSVRPASLRVMCPAA